jgi:hypothetical protein
MPAMAAALGVFRFVRLRASFGVTAYSSQRFFGGTANDYQW